MSLPIGMAPKYKFFVGMYYVQLIIRNAFMPKGHILYTDILQF